MRRAIAGVAVIVTIGSVSIGAQWPKRPAPGVPRGADGRVRMDAPTPRMSDGKPDLSGVWIRFRGEGAFTPPELSGLIRNQAAAPQTPPPPVDPNSPPIAAFWEIGANVPGGLPLTPWAAELKKQRMASNMRDNPDANCLPMGLTQFHMHGQPRKIMQNSGVIAIMYEANYGLRYIYVDGRTLPSQGSVQPFWSDDGKATRSSSRRTICGERRRAPPTAGSTSAAARTRTRRSSPSAFAGPHTASWKSTSRSTTRKRTRSHLRFESTSRSRRTTRSSSSSATRTSSSGGA